MTAKATLVAALTTLAFFTAPGALRAEPVCSETVFPSLPDVRLVSVSAETGLAPHCKVAGVIGTETHFELLLPDKWNGKFVMGGGGGFGGSVVNLALLYGALQLIGILFPTRLCDRGTPCAGRNRRSSRSGEHNVRATRAS